MNYNPLDNERTNQEKLEQIKSEKKKKNIINNKVMLFLLINILICAISLFSYFYRPFVILFKVMFGLNIASVVFILILLGMEIELSIKNWIAAIFNVLFIVLFSISGRLKISEYVVNDGFEYAVIKGDWYLYKYSGKEANVKIKSSDKYQVSKIRKNAFKNNKYVTTIEIDVLNLQFEKKAFAQCENLTDIYFINGEYTFEGEKTFNKCTQLTNVYFNNCYVVYSGRQYSSDYQDYLFDIGKSEDNLFEGTLNITVHLIKSSINCDLYGANSTTLIIYKGTKSIPGRGYEKVIFEEGFEFDVWNGLSYNLTETIASYGYQIYLPNSITRLPNDIFGSDNSMCKIYFQGNEELWKEFEVYCTDSYSQEEKGFLGIKYTAYYYGTNYKYNFNKYIQINYNSECEYWKN